MKKEKVKKLFGSVQQKIRAARFKSDKHDFLKMSLLILSGAIAGLMVCSVAENYVIGQMMEVLHDTAPLIAEKPKNVSILPDKRGTEKFEKSNPFRVFSSTQKKQETPKKSMEAFQVYGTLPGIGAWIGVNGDIKLILKNQTIEGYTLTGIKRGEVTLTDADGKKHQVYLLLSSATTSVPVNNNINLNVNKVNKVTNRNRERKNVERVKPPVDNKAGEVPKDVVNSLMSDPYKELAKIKMHPADDGSGMQMDNVDKDSVFAQVGIEKDDVIQSINGIAIQTMSDASKVVESLSKGTDFNVTVMRDGNPVDLKYQVK